MKSKVQKWGNSLALRLPKGLAVEVHLEENSAVTIQVEDGRLVITPDRRRPTLTELLDRITPDNVHAEVDFGSAAGHEVW